MQKAIIVLMVILILNVGRFLARETYWGSLIVTVGVFSLTLLYFLEYLDADDGYRYPQSLKDFLKPS